MPTSFFGLPGFAYVSQFEAYFWYLPLFFNQLSNYVVEVTMIRSLVKMAFYFPIFLRLSSSFLHLNFYLLSCPAMKHLFCLIWAQIITWILKNSTEMKQAYHLDCNLYLTLIFVLLPRYSSLHFPEYPRSTTSLIFLDFVVD